MLHTGIYLFVDLIAYFYIFLAGTIQP